VTSYQPAQNVNGQDHFTLQVMDAYGLPLTQAAQVRVQVTAVNDAPIASAAPFTLMQNQTLSDPLL
jgi:hypothetical protein